MHTRGKPESFVRISDAESQQDVEMEEAPAEPPQARTNACLVLAIDFGTTFSSVAFRKTDDVDRGLELGPGDIQCINRYPYDPSKYSVSREEVPTESCYSKLNKRRGKHVATSSDQSTTAYTLDSDSEEQETDPIFDLPVARGDCEIPTGQRDEYLWGYRVRRESEPENEGGPASKAISKTRIVRSKLILDVSPLTAGIRAELLDSISILKQKHLIGKNTDIIIDFLTHLLQHTKSQLIKYHNFDESIPVEFVVCVPVAWEGPAWHKMQTAVTQAVKRAAFSELSNSSVQNMFMVSEPEAAAASVLSDSRSVEAGEVFLLLDAGGGTVDATVFVIGQSDPLRLKREGVETAAKLCGSSILNKHFEDLLHRKLKDEKSSLENGIVTLSMIIEKCVQDFENVIKRNYDVMAMENSISIFIQGLGDNPEKGFANEHIRISTKEMNEIFMKCLKPIAEMMRQQLALAEKSKLQVEVFTDSEPSGCPLRTTVLKTPQKVVLIGGFAGSPSLQRYLEHVLARLEDIDGKPKRLITPPIPGTAVAQGAVLRALRKEDGPDRIAKSSYGCLRTEPYHGEPEMKEAHDSVKPDIDPLDNDEYVKDTISWFIKKGNLIPSEATYTYPVLHTFPTNWSTLVCKEVLFFADDRLESHYKRRDKRNRGAAVAGSIIADMTFLRDEGHIQPTIPDAGSPGKPHYKVEFDLVMIVSGRSLRYEARWPRGGGGRVINSDQIGIAASFQSGTA